MTERWRDVPGYEGLYKISDQGRVWSVRRARLRKLNRVGRGYLKVLLANEGKSESLLVHRLVAMAFLQNPENRTQINHINGDKTDNRAKNLEWCTPSENLRHRHRVLGQPGGRSIPIRCVETGALYPSEKEAAMACGVPRQSIARICRGQQKATRKNKLHFKFMEV